MRGRGERERQTDGDRHGGKMIGVKGGRPKKKKKGGVSQRVKMYSGCVIEAMC